MKETKNEKGMSTIIRENTKIYKINPGAILQTDATSTHTVTERKSIGRLIESMVIGYGIIKREYVFVMFPNKFPVNNILAETGLVNKVNKYNNRPTKI